MARRRRILERRLALINLKSGGAIRGILWSHERDLYVVRHAEYLEAEREPVRIDGEVCVDVENVAFVQILPPSAPPVPSRPTSPAIAV